MGLLLWSCLLAPTPAQQPPAAGSLALSSGISKSEPGSGIENDHKSSNRKPDGKTERPEAASAEIEEMRSQLQQAQQRIEEMQQQMDEMRSMLKQLVAAGGAAPEKRADVAIAAAPGHPVGINHPPQTNAARPTATTTAATTPAQDPRRQTSKEESTIDKLIKPKYEDGQFSGAQGLLKTDRVKVGGYMDFRFVTRGIDDGNEIRTNIAEENADNLLGTNFKRNSFTTPRLVLGVAAALTDRLLFNSEIEFEFAGKETEVEQAYLEYRLHPMLNFRGGVITPPLGRFNLYHDSNLQDIAARPLASTFVIPSTYKDAGVGALGEFRLGRQMRLGYEGYVTNGLRSDEGGEIARAAGLFESKGNNRFFDNNRSKAAVGRLLFSPKLGVELGLSGYRGKHDNQDLYNLSIWAVDWKYNWRGLQVLGQYARSAMQRGPESDEELASRDFLRSLSPAAYSGSYEDLSDLLNPLFENPARSSDGWYIETRYRFHPRWLTAHTSEDASIAPVFRYDQVNLDRSFSNFSFPLNVRRTGLGFSLRPTEAASLNLTYYFDQRPSLLFNLLDGTPLPPFFTNAGNKRALSLGLVWAF